ncbi:uncharacterized protein K460DRAFT_291673 [Cucurbitaria berberidis CBS 394.84]|uniref:Uncharacterized protein n=1 Tax=Cucurbitaria berberidis CBS 394.84 TaxID=1168544 RepID=A0A9P4GAL0_9PLEO|nr:uncharacterized protein K460DRAFT_291673 [Cucurbitaria berberidis CBS 394.84]KAF1842041.1 hypothetical protein K460DRAFT_291673 [Cucurbitaria berberidis CBS 394.84]
MFPSAKDPRKTSILDDSVGLELNLAQQGNGKGKGKNRQNTAGGFSFSSSRNAGVVKSKPAPTARATQNLGARFYERDGLKIPLYEKKGKKRAHARASVGLRNKSEEELLSIVGEYAGTEVMREFKQRARNKKEIAEWIEAKETLALGPNPKSQLNRKSQAEITKGEYLEDKLTGVATQLEANGATRPDKVARGRNSSTPTPTAKLKESKVHKSTEAHDAFIVQSNRTSPAKVAPSVDKKRGAPDGALDGQPHLKHQKLDSQANMPSTDVISTNGLPAKKKATKPMAELSAHTESAHSPTTQSAERISATDLLQALMNDVGLSPSQVETSTRIVALPKHGENRVLTVTSNTKTGQVTLHDTGIPSCYNDYNGSQAVQAITPYLKKGKHGPNGDFFSDPARATGKGHDYDPDDTKRYDEFLHFRCFFYKRYPSYPKLHEGEKIEPEVKAAWDVQQAWYGKFSEKYPGRRLDQWPCGCRKLCEESESESESEEE